MQTKTIAKNFTLAMIKPDAVRAKHVGTIVVMIKKAGVTLQALQLTRLSLSEAHTLYRGIEF